MVSYLNSRALASFQYATKSLANCTVNLTMNRIEFVNHFCNPIWAFPVVTPSFWCKSSDYFQNKLHHALEYGGPEGSHMQIENVAAN